ncbi:HRDC domain-containing protein [Francisellaceae bacterium CB300]|jgi:ribonuclease D
MLIQSQSILDAAIAEISQNTHIAVDTEFYWMRTYYPELCLIQIATINDIYLIDTLEDLDFSGLNYIFETNDIQKILHSAANDVPIIKRFLDCEINNIFDTQLAATFLGFANQLSLKNLLQEILNIEMEKESQFSDWRKRPLSANQIAYAKKDVEYLITLQKDLDKKLIDIGYHDFFEEELIDICQIGFNNLEVIHNKVGNIQKFSEKVQRNIIAVAKWREETAQQKDIPVRFLFDNKVLYAIARIAPTSHDDFASPEIIRLNSSIKNGIITAIKTSNEHQHLTGERKYTAKLDNETVDKIIDFFNTELDNYKFDNSSVASKKDIRSLIYNLKLENDDINNKLLKGWRYEIVGRKLKEYILRLL